ncbi:hypothetical protein GCM10011383_43270 [Hymenobacter cavernae]|uniref:Uncharacterized protein n=1 Tax=Hymenobacter cavernae TaxID=2044852 RepID=A0ABQ1UTW7_9BACT|nr:hypothetical protein GCM10011383_43270 [Hymenobacter cavernae]
MPSSNTIDEEWINKVEYQEPNYVGENNPIWIVIEEPIVGLILMLIMLPRGMRKT